MTAKTATLVDRFTSEGYSQAKWFNWTTFPTAFSMAGNQLTITPSTDYPGLVSEEVLDLTGSTLHVELVQALNAGNGSTDVDFGVVRSTSSTQYREMFVVEGATLYFQEKVAGVANNTSISYDPIAHRWLRLREDSGTLYWETSPDGLNWTVQRSKAPGFDLSSVQPSFDAGYWDTEPDPGVAIFRNINAYTVPATQQGWSVGAIGFGAVDGGTLMYKNFFPEADWLWTPIPDSPVLDPNSAAIVADLTAPGISLTNGDPYTGEAGVSVYDVSATLVPPGLITADTPRYRIPMDRIEEWGGGEHPFGDDLVPIPEGTLIPPGVDGHIAIADPVNGKVYSLWQARREPDGSYAAAWGGVAELDGDGREVGNGSSTATRLSRYAAVLRMSEMIAREIPHALFFAAGNTETMTFQYPASKSDGYNYRGSAHPIREGQRIQLDPTLDVAALPGIGPAELAVARAMQKYGAYCGDKSDQGGGWGFICQLDPTATGIEHPGQTYVDAGIAYDYFRFSHVPWSTHLRVLKNWDGS